MIDSIWPDSKFAEQVKVGDVVVEMNGSKKWPRGSEFANAKSIVVKKLRWCQGVLDTAYEDREEALVKWDAMPDVDGCDKVEWSYQVLKSGLFNKDCVGAWRMDVDAGDIVPTDEEESNDSPASDDVEMEESDAEEDSGSVCSASSSEVSVSSDSSDEDE